MPGPTPLNFVGAAWACELEIYFLTIKSLVGVDETKGILEAGPAVCSLGRQKSHLEQSLMNHYGV